MSDLIERDALFKQIEIDSEGIEGSYGDTWKFIDTIKNMPSAQPEKRTNKRTETHECDLISRQQAILALTSQHDTIPTDIALDVLRELPSAEPHTFRVIDTKTKEEADTYEIALKEEWAKGLCYCDMEGFAIEEDGTLILLDECGRCAYCPQGRFEVEWDG